MHYYNQSRGFKHHAFEAIQMEDSGSEALLETFRVTKKRSAEQAYEAAESLCERARTLAHKPAAFVREINAPGEDAGDSTTWRPAKLRIRHCEGNKAAWMLVALTETGSEIDSYGGYRTALSLDALLRVRDHLSPRHGEVVELVI